MNNTRNVANEIQGQIHQVKPGSVRIWGEWFGKPYDNLHTLKRCDSHENVLQLYFDEDEKLSIWAPRGLTISPSTLRIIDADRVRWEWYYYGKVKSSNTLYFEDFTKLPKGIIVTTNIDWYKPDFKPSASEAAVEIL